VPLLRLCVASVLVPLRNVTVPVAEAGVTAEGLARLMAPIGLDIGARTPEETAVAVCAEIIALRTGRAAGSLRDTSGPIHSVG